MSIFNKIFGDHGKKLSADSDPKIVKLFNKFANKKIETQLNAQGLKVANNSDKTLLALKEAARKEDFSISVQAFNGAAGASGSIDISSDEVDADNHLIVILDRNDRIDDMEPVW